MPKRKYKWWPNVIAAMQEHGNPYVAAALEKARERMSGFDYAILMDCIEKKYLAQPGRKKTIFQIALDHGTSEWCANKIRNDFVFMVAKEMGYIK